MVFLKKTIQLSEQRMRAQERSLEWVTPSPSLFFGYGRLKPRGFEFGAIHHRWVKVCLWGNRLSRDQDGFLGLTSSLLQKLASG